MFESNTDFEFDNDLFGDSFQPEPPTRTLAGDPRQAETSKKRCLNTHQSTPPKKLNNTQPASQNEALNLLIDRLQWGQRRSEPTFTSQSTTEFKRHTSFSSPAKKIVHRKFPGPAGLLPDPKDVVTIINTGKSDYKESKPDNTGDLDLCSQMSMKSFRGGAWEQMSKDFRPVDSRSVFLPDKYNVAWVKAKAKGNRLINQKAPFLAAVIQGIECAKSKTADVTMLLKDETGQIQATMRHDLFEEYVDVLKVGSVVILKQFGVLTTDYGSNHYVTITANNLVCVYRQEGDVDASGVTVATVQKVSVEDLVRSIAEVKTRHQTALWEQQLNPNFEIRCNFKPTSDGLANHNSPLRNLSTRTNNSVSNGTELNVTNISRLSEHHRHLNKESGNLVNHSSTPRFNFNSVSRPTKAVSRELLRGDKEELVPQPNTIKCSQICITSDNVEHCAILQNVFEGVDVDLLFEDF